MPYFIVRFTLRTAQETLGNWSANLKASVWREVWVATAPLKRGERGGACLPHPRTPRHAQFA